MTGGLTHQQVLDAGIDDWRLLMSPLQARFRTGDFATGLALVNRIGQAAEEADHHPDLDLRYAHLNVRLLSHDVDAVTERDVALARRISEIAREMGVEADPRSLSQVEVALDTPDPASVRPFWLAVLGVPGGAGGDDVRDREGDTDTLWFQPSGSEEGRQRFHYDVRVPPEVAQERIDAALAAGGTLVSDAAAPAYVVLADPDGNKVCVCTSAGRD
ncbi:4a-hydroxytetrahydrobiopterin dehydratase [uncultured Nocardioides sp.]|uniref:4a-hydroxytetrahydrobiopterin dehydratase n=1 Tax=uncultured Nocardioides sp. TaxID=198441 RepID=UPI0025E7F8B9|nr:4a-hydroxytetrahydrobiopterin dehydratase [uncultured Nocardioides sp.]